MWRDFSFVTVLTKWKLPMADTYNFLIKVPIHYILRAPSLCLQNLILIFFSLEPKCMSKFIFSPPCCMARFLMAGNWWLPEVSRKSTFSLRPAVSRQKSLLYCSSTVGSCWCWGGRATQCLHFDKCLCGNNYSVMVISANSPGRYS